MQRGQTRTIEAFRANTSGHLKDPQQSRRSEPTREHVTHDDINPALRDLSAGADDINPALRDLSAGADDINPALRDLSAGADDINPALRDLSAGADDINPAFARFIALQQIHNWLAKAWLTHDPAHQHLGAGFTEEHQAAGCKRIGYIMLTPPRPRIAL